MEIRSSSTQSSNREIGEGIAAPDLDEPLPDSAVDHQGDYPQSHQGLPCPSPFITFCFCSLCAVLQVAKGIPTNSLQHLPRRIR